VPIPRAPYFAYFGADGKELPFDRLLATQIICHGSAAEKSADRTLLESNLCYYGRNSLTKKRFAWKISTHFTMLAPRFVPSMLTSTLPVILQFPIPQVRDPVRSLRHMTTQLLSEAAQVIPNQQLLINVVSKRVRQLGLGHRPLVETTPRMSLTDIALKEIIAGKLTYESLEGSSDGA
jgi:DNA-directed RNA polymerase subunit omega